MQQFIGNFLFYGRAIGVTILKALSSVSSAQVAPTEDALKRTHNFLYYSATRMNAILTYNASDMVLTVHIDTS